MLDKKIREAISFVNNVNIAKENGKIDLQNLDKAKEYLDFIDSIQGYDQNIAVLESLRARLKNIIRVLNTYRRIGTTISTTNINDNITECIIGLIKYKGLTNKYDIARMAYRELGKYLYYDISYDKVQTEEEKDNIVNKKIDPENTRIFTYLVCSQWSILYDYILKSFGIDSKIIKEKNGRHHWVEIDMHDGNIIIADATDYINGKIDFSTCKSNSKTVGYMILPKEYSNTKLRNFIENPANQDEYKISREYIKENNTKLRNMDTNLGYTKNGLYNVERILKENDLFKYPNSIVSEEKKEILIKRVIKFFETINIPNNLDGYEIYAYYIEFIRKLPINIRGSISMHSIFVDTTEYKAKKINSNYLHASMEYLYYLLDKIRHDIFTDGKNKDLYKNIENGIISEIVVAENSIKKEEKEAETSFRGQAFYAINELTIYGDEDEVHFLYEPTTGIKKIYGREQTEEYKAINRIK